MFITITACGKKLYLKLLVLVYSVAPTRGEKLEQVVPNF